MTKQEQMAEEELDQVAGGIDVGPIARRAIDVGPVGRVGIEPNPSPAPRFSYDRIGIAPLPSP